MVIRLIVIQSMHFHVGIIAIIERNSIQRAERSRWREKRSFYCAILSIISYMNVFDTRTEAIYRSYSGLANRFFLAFNKLFNLCVSSLFGR